MSNINERLQTIINELYNGNVSEFERASDIKPYTVKNIVGSRKTKPSYDMLESILRNNVQISASWLLTGKGEMFKSENPTVQPLVSNGSGTVGGVVGGNVTGNGHNIGIIPSDTERALVRAEWEVEHFKKEIKVLKEQLKQITANKEKEIENLKEQLKQAVIDKDRAMNMLDKALNKGS